MPTGRKTPTQTIKKTFRKDYILYNKICVRTNRWIFSKKIIALNFVLLGFCFAANLTNCDCAPQMFPFVCPYGCFLTGFCYRNLIRSRGVAVPTYKRMYILYTVCDNKL